MNKNTSRSLVKLIGIIMISVTVLLFSACQMPSTGGSGNQGGGSGEQGGGSGEQGGGSGETGGNGEQGGSGTQGGGSGEQGGGSGETGGKDDGKFEDTDMEPELVGLYDPKNESLYADWVWIYPGIDYEIVALFRVALPDGAAFNALVDDSCEPERYDATRINDVTLNGETYAAYAAKIPAITTEGEYALELQWWHGDNNYSNTYRLTVDDAIDNPSGTAGVIAGAAPNFDDYYYGDSVFLRVGYDSTLYVRYTAPVSNLWFHVYDLGIALEPDETLTDGEYTVYRFTFDTTTWSYDREYEAELSHGSSGADVWFDRITLRLGDDEGPGSGGEVDPPSENYPNFIGVSSSDALLPEGDVVYIPGDEDTMIFLFFDKEINPNSLRTDYGEFGDFKTYWFEGYFVVGAPYPKMPAGDYKATLEYEYEESSFSAHCGVSVTVGSDTAARPEFLGISLNDCDYYRDITVNAGAETSVIFKFSTTVDACNFFYQQNMINGRNDGTWTDTDGYFYVSTIVPALRPGAESIKIEFSANGAFFEDYATVYAIGGEVTGGSFIGASNDINGGYDTNVDVYGDSEFTVYVAFSETLDGITLMLDQYEQEFYPTSVDVREIGAIYSFTVPPIFEGRQGAYVHKESVGMIASFTVTSISSGSGDVGSDVTFVGAMTPDMIGPMEHIELYTEKENEIWLVFDGEVSYAMIDLDGNPIPGMQIDSYNGYTTYSFILPQILVSGEYKIYVQYNGMDGSYYDGFLPITAHGVMSSYDATFFGTMLTPDGTPETVLQMDRNTAPVTIYLAFDVPAEIRSEFYVGGLPATVGECFKQGEYYLLPVTIEPITAGIHHEEYFRFGVQGYPDREWDAYFQIALSIPPVEMPEFLGVKLDYESDELITDGNITILPNSTHIIRFVFSGNLAYVDQYSASTNMNYCRFEQIEGGYEAIIEYYFDAPGEYPVNVDFPVINEYGMGEGVHVECTVLAEIDSDPVFIGVRPVENNGEGFANEISMIYTRGEYPMVEVAFDREVFIQTLTIGADTIGVHMPALSYSDGLYVWNWMVDFNNHFGFTGIADVKVTYLYCGIEYTTEFKFNVIARDMIAWCNADNDECYELNEHTLEIDENETVNFLCVYNFRPERVRMNLSYQEWAYVDGTVLEYDEARGGYPVLITLSPDLFREINDSTLKLVVTAYDGYGEIGDSGSHLMILNRKNVNLEVYGVATDPINAPQYSVAIAPGGSAYVFCSSKDETIRFELYSRNEYCDTVYASEITMVDQGGQIYYVHRLDFDPNVSVEYYLIDVFRGTQHVNGEMYRIDFVE